MQAEVDALPKQEICTISVDSFLPLNPTSLSEDEKLGIVAKRKEVQEIIDLFQDICTISNRLYHYMDQILCWNPNVDIDWLIFDKILSAVRIDRNNVKEAEKLVVELETREYPSAKEKLLAMIADVNGELVEESYYWR